MMVMMVMMMVVVMMMMIVIIIIIVSAMSHFVRAHGHLAWWPRNSYLFSTCFNVSLFDDGYIFLHPSDSEHTPKRKRVTGSKAPQTVRTSISLCLRTVIYL